MTLSFPADVFARIEPGIYLQRHLEKGLRPVPGLRKFDEFRPVSIEKGTLSGCIGSALVKVGGTTVISGVSLSTSEMGPGGVYPNVEIVRGGASRNAPPTQEEMLLSQQSFNALQPQLSDNLFIREDLPDLYLVLNVSVQVLSRIGPCFDAVYNCIVAALNDTMIPVMELDPDTKKVIVKEAKGEPLLNSPLSLSSTFGVAEMKDHKLAVVADLEGETEESCISSRIQANVIPKSDTFTQVSIRIVDSTASQGKSGIRLTKDHVEYALNQAQAHSSNLSV